MHSSLFAPKNKNALSALVLLGCLTACSLLLYSNFIFGKDVFIFAGVGADSIGQTVPFLLNEASRLEAGDISQWNQYQFLGAPTIQFLNLEYIPSLFGRDAIPAMMLVMQICKIYLTGIFFYLFLGYHNLKLFTRIIAALGLAFCGRMIELAPWTAYTIEIVFATGMLWGFERFLVDNKKMAVLSVMVACIGLTQGLYATVLYSLVLIMYAIFRIGYIWDENWGPKRAASTALKLATSLLLGYLIASPILYPSIKMYATSARVSSDFSVSFSPFHLFVPTNISLFAEEIVKLFSNGILGHMNSYRGSSNILNAPYFCCGIVLTLTLPMAFKDKTNRQRGFLLFIAISAFFYMYSTGFRYLLNGFSVSGDDFRQSSFWVVMVIALLGAYGLDKALENNATNRNWLIACLIIELLLFLATCVFLGNKISLLYLALTLGFLLVYAFLLLTIVADIWSRARALLLFALVFTFSAEIVSQNFMPIRQSTYITMEQYTAHFSTNPDQIVQSSQNVNRNTYRIDYKAIDLTNPMSNAYLGTQAYIGGAGINQQVNDFLANSANSNVRELGFTRYIYGYNDISSNSLLGAKYLVAQNGGVPLALPFGYRMIEENDRYSLAENIYSLPLLYGYSYSDIQDIDTLSSLPYHDRFASLMDKAVISEPKGQSSIDNNPDIITDKEAERSLDSTCVTPESGCRINLPETSSPYIQIDMSLHDEPTPSGMLVIYIDFFNQDGILAARYPYITANGHEDIRLPIQNQNYSAVEIKITNVNACAQPYIDNISYTYTTESDYKGFIDSYLSRTANYSTVSTYEGNELVANIQMKAAGYIATSIPWDESWKMYVDGIEVETNIVNLGFVGAEVEKGEHNVVLIYDDSPLYACMGISLCVLALVLMLELKIAYSRGKEGHLT